MLFLLLLLLTHTTQSIKFFISSPLYSPKQDLIQQRNVPFAVTVDYKNADAERLSSTFIQVSLRLNNKDYIVKLFRQNFGHQFGETRGIQLSQRNKEQVLLICKTVRLLGIHKDKTQQCAHLHLALRKIMAASMCSHVISHVCVGESCAPFRGGTTAVSVTLTETGVHWLKVVPRYSQPACSLDKQEHIINTPPIRTIVVDCDCPFVSRIVAPTHGSWTLCKSKKEWQHVHMVRTRQHLVGCKHAQDSDKERERERGQEGRVCMRSKNMSFCGEQGASAATLEMFVASPSSVTLKSWWDEPEGKCTNITTITTFNTYTTNATYNNRPNDGLELIVLTGLNDKYINNLKQLVGSMVLYNPIGTIEIVDLGLSNQSIAAIKAWTTPTINITIIPFHFEKYPPHVHDLSTYAFKILAIQEGLTRHPSGLLWIDAGRVARSLSRAWREIASDEGMFFQALLPTSSGIHPFPWGNSAYHHNETMKRVGLESVNVKQTQCDGAVQGWSKHGSFYNKAFPMLVKCALDVHCITPIGSNRQNHLQDQTVLNAVFSKLKVDPCKGNKLFDSEYNSEYNTMREMAPSAMFRRSYPLARDVFELYLENSEEHQSMDGVEGGAPLECHKDDDPKYSCKHVVHSENISITNLLGVTEHSLFTIRGCDLNDPVTLAKQFLQRWKGVGRFSHILSTVLDKICGGIQGVRCKKGTELIHDHFTDIGEVIIRMDSNIMTVVKQKFQETNTHRSSMYAVLRQICERLRYACFKQQTLGISRKPLSLELDSTFDGREMDFATTMETLTNIATVAAVEAGESGIEGNLWMESIPQQSTSHDRIPGNTEDHERIEQARRKRECTIFAMGVQWPPPQTFLEVGFNAGHSLALFLHFVPSIEHVYEFDLCNHAYTVSNFEVVKTSAPHVQMSLTCGNSRATLAAAARAKTMGKVDAIHIDGGHDFDTAWADITNAGHFATGSTLLIIDDVHDTSSLEGAASAAIDGGIIELLGGFSAACRYGSVFGRYTKEFLNSLKENESD